MGPVYSYNQHYVMFPAEAERGASAPRVRHRQRPQPAETPAKSTAPDIKTPTATTGHKLQWPNGSAVFSSDRSAVRHRFAPDEEQPGFMGRIVRDGAEFAAHVWTAKREYRALKKASSFSAALVKLAEAAEAVRTARKPKRRKTARPAKPSWSA